MNFKFSLLLLLFTSILTQQVTILVSEPSTTIIPDITGRHVHNISHSTPTFDGAQWISDNSSSTWPPGYRMSFETSFTIDCPQQPAILTIIGDDNFEAYLNGQLIGNGSGWRTAYNFTVYLNCGNNNLTTVAINNSGNQGIIFSLVQNQTNCYICNTSFLLAQTVSTFVDPTQHHYDSSVCECGCTSIYNCTAPLEWFTFPLCGCACPLVPSCPTYYVLDSVECKCNSISNTTQNNTAQQTSQDNGNTVLWVILVGMILFTIGTIIGLACCSSKRIHPDQTSSKSNSSKIQQKNVTQVDENINAGIKEDVFKQNISNLDIVNVNQTGPSDKFFTT